MIPRGRFANDAVQYAHEGIEIKASRYVSGWRGHNPENAWLMVFVFDSNRPTDALKGMAPKPFEFRMVVGAQIIEADRRVAERKVRRQKNADRWGAPDGTREDDG
jgi:hypothetical protein